MHLALMILLVQVILLAQMILAAWQTKSALRISDVKRAMILRIYFMNVYAFLQLL